MEDSQRRYRSGYRRKLEEKKADLILLEKGRLECY